MAPIESAAEPLEPGLVRGHELTYGQVGYGFGKKALAIQKSPLLVMLQIIVLISQYPQNKGQAGQHRGDKKFNFRFHGKIRAAEAAQIK